MTATTIGSASTPRGEVVLRRRIDDGHLELRVNGIFVMDTAETTTETALAEELLARLRPAPGGATAERPLIHVLVGGLGLGVTVHRLTRSPLVDRIDVVEIEDAVIEWHTRGLIQPTASIVTDGRVHLIPGNVQDVIAETAPGELAAILLDVDNGPGYLVYEDNSSLYRTAFLALCRRALRDEGVLVVWSADASSTLEADLEAVFAIVEHRSIEVLLGERQEHYHLYVGVVADSDRPPAARSESRMEG